MKINSISQELIERKKELNCLVEIASLISKPGISLDEILQETVNLIPDSFQHPVNTGARITVEEGDFQTTNYQDSPWKKNFDVLAGEDVCGSLEVCYQEGDQHKSGDPFLVEEVTLIESIAKILGHTIKRFRLENHLVQENVSLAILEERERLGRELHDDLAQMISYIHMQVVTANNRLEENQTQDVKSILTQLIRVTQEVQVDVRHFILGIRKSTRSTKGAETESFTSPDFFQVLDGYLELLHERYGLEVKVIPSKDWLDSIIAPEVETQLLSILQEALLNICKHAGVTETKLIFTAFKDDVEVIIADDGCGFDSNRLIDDAIEKGERHFGLAIIRERAEVVGGRIEIQSRPGKGTTIIVRLPRTITQINKALGKGVRVLLVDDHPLYLEGLRSLLSARGFQVIGTAQDGLQAQRLAQILRPDLILMDVKMPTCDGLEATKQIKQQLPDTKIVMLTVASEENTLLEAIENGASGYLLKSLEGERFFSLLGDILQEKSAFSPELASILMEEFIKDKRYQKSKAEDISSLTSRQEEVLELAAKGLNNREIANRLHITEATVKYHISQILNRLDIKSRYQLARFINQR